MDCKNNSTRAVFRSKDRRKNCSKGWALSRTDAQAIRAIWVESYLHWDFSLIKNHYILPTSFDCGLFRPKFTQGIKVLVISIPILICTHKFGPLRVTSHRMSIHHSLMPALISLDQPIHP